MIQSEAIAGSEIPSEATTQITTWQERLQSEYVDLKTKLDGLNSHLRNNADDMEHKAVQLLRRQQVTMNSYLGILAERMHHHDIEVPGLENADGQ